MTKQKVGANTRKKCERLECTDAEAVGNSWCSSDERKWNRMHIERMQDGEKLGQSAVKGLHWENERSPLMYWI